MAGLRDYLQTVYEKHGQLTPDLVVQEARPAAHPLHRYVFDKAPVDAAEAYYRERARLLIREQMVVYREADEDGPARRVRAWQSLRTPTGIVWEPAAKIADDKILSAFVLNEMEREYRSMEERFGHFQEFVALARATVRRHRRRKAA